MSPPPEAGISGPRQGPPGGPRGPEIGGLGRHRAPRRGPYGSSQTPRLVGIMPLWGMVIARVRYYERSEYYRP